MATGNITRKDLITDEGLSWGSEYAKNLQIAIDKNDELIKSSKQLFTLYQQLQGVANNKQLVAIQNKQIQITQTATKAYEDQGKALAKVDEERQKSLSSLLRTTNKLQNVNTTTNKQNIEARETLRLQNLEIKRNMTFIGRLTNERDKARKSVQDLQAKQALGFSLSDREQKELRESTKAYTSYEKKLQAIKKATGQWQDDVGKYPRLFGGAIKSIKSFLPLIGAGFGLREAFNFAKEARQLAIEAKGVEFAFDRLGDTGVDAFERVKASTRGLLSDLDIKKALVDFDNFNLSLEESDTLFEFLAVRAAQTGQSIEQLQSSLVEGLSKESKLRIDNLGISATELNAELEKTPDFVKAVANIAKREIAEAGNILDEAGNSQQRFNAAYQNFQLEIGKGFVAKASDAIYDFGANVLNAITPTKRLSDAVKEEQFELNILVQKVTDVNLSNEERAKKIQTLQQKYPGFLKNLDTEKVSNEDIRDRLKEVNQGYVAKIALQDFAQEVDEKSKESSDKLRVAFEAENRAREKLTKTLGVEEAERLTNGRTLQEAIDLALEEVGVTEDLIKAQNKGVNALNSRQKALLDVSRTLETSVRFEGKSNDLRNEASDLQEKLNQFAERYADVLDDINQIKKEENAGNEKEVQARNVKYLNELIAKEKQRLDQATTRSEAKIIQEKIKLLEKELESILGGNKAYNDRKNLLEQDAFNLDKQRLQSQADAQKRILDSDKETTSRRLAAVVNYTDKSILLLQLERDRAIKLAKGRADEIKRIELAYSDDYDALIRERASNTQTVLQSSFEKTKARLEEERKIESDAINSRIAQEQAKLQNDLENLSGKQKIERINQYEETVAQIRREASEEQLQNAIDNINIEIENLDKLFLRRKVLGLTSIAEEEQYLELRKQLTESLTAAEIDLSNKKTDNSIENAEKEAEVLQTLLEFKQDIISKASQNIADSLGLDARNIEDFFNVFITKAENAAETLGQIATVSAFVGDVVGAVFDANIQGIDEQIDAQEEYYDRQIELAGEDESQRAALEEERELKRQELEEKKRQEQIKAAKFAKAFSIFNIGVTTAQAVIAALAPPPVGLGPLLGGPLAITAGALGALQIAAVLAKPIPKYRYGTEDHVGGLAEVAEVRPEVIMEPGKKPYIQKTRATLNLAPHTKVIPSVEEFSNQMIAASIMTSLAHDKHNLNHYETLLAFEKYTDEMVGELKENTRAIKRLKLGVNIQNQKYDIPYQLFRSQNIKW
jgi:hypothetical protein